MRKSNDDIPMIIFDTRISPEPVVEEIKVEEYEKENKWEMELSPASENRFEPEFLLLFQKIMEGLHKPMMAFKDQFANLTKGRVQYQQIPWFKIGLVLLAGFILLKKDMRFNVALSSPTSVVTDDQESGEKKVVKNTALQASVNPYAPVSASDLREEKSKAFIREYSALAVEDMHQYGIPASIKIAQALIESRSGQSKLARKNNNFFGIKCFSKKCAKGHCTNAYDDHHKDFFRKFSSPVDSWKAHSRLLSQGRYKPLHNYKLDYKKWAEGLKKVGYATDKNYARKLISVIKKYKLNKLDKL